MNPLSAFSFGKVIKTFIPGLIATAAVLLVVETIYRTSVGTSCLPSGGFWGCFFRESFFRRVVLAEGARTTAFGALLIPLALMLGFLLNTVTWFCLNARCRGRADRAMDPTLRAARTSLEADARAAFTTIVGDVTPAPAVHLGDFFLPLMNMERLTFLHDSYFAWYEFHLNSLAALLLCALAYAVAVIGLAVRWGMAINWVTHVVLPVALMLALAWFLAVAGMRNLRRYQEGLVWFLVGTLHFK
jgi:hypothetical protein